ncbi:MAG: family 31 glucosidase [Spirochaetaceae bacterium]|jgi:alpha-D-xyloside xylohydrolase|nr:family 31 glucosidase [Spirochaetaceae bacterium]
MSLYTVNKNTLECRLGNETVKIIPWGKNSVCIIAVPIGEAVLTDWALLPEVGAQQGNEASVNISVDENVATLVAGKLTVKAEKTGWRERIKLSFYKSNSGELLFAEADAGGALNLHARNFDAIRGGSYKITASFTADPAEHLYGMGQYQQDIIDVKNCSFELAHRNSQASVPFVVSSKGYGFLWHNPAIGRASFAKNGTEWSAESAKQLDYWVTAGDTPAEIMSAYADATGHAPKMPEYGLGFWQCKLRYWNQEQILRIAREYKKRNLPIDVIVCDFYHWPHTGDFHFEKEYFPDPDAMIAELESMHIKLMVSIWPQIDAKSENFKEMADEGLLVQSDRGVPTQYNGGDYFGNCLFYDVTNPRARDYVWQKCKVNYFDKGVRIFWLDEAEPEYSTYDFPAYHYHLGSALEVGNLYPQLYAKGFYEGQKASGQSEIVNLLRCAWAGSQRYGALVWSGDIHSNWETLRRQICAGLNMGMAGIPWWTTDIGGFAGGRTEDPAFQELLVRWFQWGCFCPVMRLHGDRLPAEIIKRKDGSSNVNSGADNEVWSFGEANYKILEKYLHLREKLRAYIRQIMDEASEKGSPVMRPMFYEFPDDAQCFDLKDQYMFGSKYLVAPVLEAGCKTRQVYLPRGNWTEIDTGKTYQGGATVTVNTPIESIPVFEFEA